VYKSPTTIHVFAFSADDPNLFPSIPPVDPSVIRTQVDLQGWSIEALSPTTTLVSLLEQSDPKGWSNKASIPQQMIAAVAGVGDFVIKCGGPPLMTRLEGAKVNDMRYDHEKGSLRIEYESAPKRISSSNDNTDTPPPSSTPMIECELRCDLDNWAVSLDIVIDPPPQSIGCLRRHRLSSGGGGLWLTICHDAVNAGSERLQIIVRRAPQGVAKEKGLVMINGTKVSVDTEDLPEREVKNLAKQKRVKPTRIPLDQPPVLGVIRRRKAEWDADADDNATETGDPPSDTPTVVATEMTTTAPAFATTLSRYWNFAIEQATVTTQQAVAAVSPAIAAGDDAIPSASKAPMQHALEALSYLQVLHSQSLADGWTLLSDKEFPVHRKIEPTISSVIPVHRGEKIIEGLSADEISNVLTNYDCRKQWDTRFDSAHIFEQYGAHAHTSFVVTKGGFPFRDRGFHLANVLARAPSTRQTSGDSEHAADNRMVVFIVSASFSPDSAQSFAPAKYNPYTLPIGRIFIEGWILETLDPYGSESLAIPSTRCIRVVAADYAGSIPAAVNSNINAMLVKSILPLEAYLKNISPLPFTRIPASGHMVPARDDSIDDGKAWSIKKKDLGRTAITTAYNPATKSYRSLTILNATEARIPSPPPSTISFEKLRRATISSGRARTVSRTEVLPNSVAVGDPDKTLVKVSVPKSPPSSVRSRSRDALRSSSVFTSRGEVKLPMDLTVGELVVDTKLYPTGYSVWVHSRIDKARQPISLFDGTDSASAWSDVLPIVTSAYTMPPSPLHSSGLNTDRPPCHLLRLTLPTAQYQMSTIHDPLTGETRTAPARPQWLLDLDEGRAIIQVEIKPSATSATAAQLMTSSIMVNDVAVNVMKEKESLTSLGRDEMLDVRASKMNVLVR
jgi:hypothetical protein